MLKIILSTLTAGTLLAMSYLPAAAHHSIDLRQAKQAEAIERGRLSGKITWREGRQLRREQRRIRRLEARFRRSDGRIDRAERRILHAKLDEARRNIRAQKRDSQRRWASLPRFGR
jgi:hypothetical protein